MSTSRSTFCILPFIHLETRTEGTLTPCCISREKIPKNSQELFHLSEDSMKDAFQSEYMQDLRRALKSGVKHSNCEVCWLEEAAGAESKRIRENFRFRGHLSSFQESELEPEIPIFLDLKLGNTCNLKCRICGPNNSSKWMEENLRTHGNDFLDRPTLRLKSLSVDESRKQIVQWPNYAPYFWQELEQWLPEIVRFEIFGGEPFLSKDHIELLEKSVKSGYSKKQSIHYNTNGTVYPPKLIEEILPKFKQVSLMVSIDGIQDRFEYQRYPAKFDQVLKNLESFKRAGLDPRVCSTVSKLTMPTILQDLDFWNSVGYEVFLNFLYEPSYMDIRTFSETAKKSLTQLFSKNDNQFFKEKSRLEAIVTHMNSGTFPNQDNDFLLSMQKLDKVRSQSFEKIFCETFELISKT